MPTWDDIWNEYKSERREELASVAADPQPVDVDAVLKAADARRASLPSRELERAGWMSAVVSLAAAVIVAVCLWPSGLLAENEPVTMADVWLAGDLL